jgi:hypothetical protein
MYEQQRELKKYYIQNEWDSIVLGFVNGGIIKYFGGDISANRHEELRLFVLEKVDSFYSSCSAEDNGINAWKNVSEMYWSLLGPEKKITMKR